MTTLLLIRHGQTDANGKSIMGWQKGWHLNAAGQQQVAALAERLKRIPIRAVYTTPLRRARDFERYLDTPARIYYKHEGVSPSGSHKLNSAR